MLPPTPKRNPAAEARLRKTALARTRKTFATRPETVKLQSEYPKLTRRKLVPKELAQAVQVPVAYETDLASSRPLAPDLKRIDPRKKAWLVEAKLSPTAQAIFSGKDRPKSRWSVIYDTFIIVRDKSVSAYGDRRFGLDFTLEDRLFHEFAHAALYFSGKKTVADMAKLKVPAAATAAGVNALGKRTKADLLALGRKLTRVGAVSGPPVANLQLLAQGIARFQLGHAFSVTGKPDRTTLRHLDKLYRLYSDPISLRGCVEHDLLDRAGYKVPSKSLCSNTKPAPAPKGSR